MLFNAGHRKQRDKSIYLLHIGEQVLTSSYRKVRITHALYLRRAVNNETLWLMGAFGQWMTMMMMGCAAKFCFISLFPTLPHVNVEGQQTGTGVCPPLAYTCAPNCWLVTLRMTCGGLWRLRQRRNQVEGKARGGLLDWMYLDWVTDDAYEASDGL